MKKEDLKALDRATKKLLALDKAEFISLAKQHSQGDIALLLKDINYPSNERTQDQPSFQYEKIVWDSIPVTSTEEYKSVIKKYSSYNQDFVIYIEPPTEQNDKAETPKANDIQEKQCLAA